MVAVYPLGTPLLYYLLLRSKYGHRETLDAQAAMERAVASEERLQREAARLQNFAAARRAHRMQS